MFKTTVLYSLKVWLTSVVVAPCLCLIIDSAREGMSGYKAFDLLDLEIYFRFIFFELIFSFVTWMFFFAAIFLILIIPGPAPIKRLIISIVGVLLTVATFAIILGITFDLDILTIMVCNCIVIGFGTLFFKLKTD